MSRMQIIEWLPVTQPPGAGLSVLVRTTDGDIRIAFLSEGEFTSGDGDPEVDTDFSDLDVEAWMAIDDGIVTSILRDLVVQVRDYFLDPQRTGDISQLRATIKEAEEYI